MSMLKKLKETQKNSVFLDDEDDIDNMDFPLPDDQNDPMSGLQDLMKKMSAGADMRPQASSSKPSGNISVATTPQGVRTMDPSEYKDWVCVYPAYIDADKSVTEGRKISKSSAVKNPHAYHMALAVQSMGLSVVYEGKKHPRDWANPGRVRVQLKNKSNFFMNPNCTTRKQLFKTIADRLPTIQKESKLPGNILSPLATLAQVEAIADDHRKAQGLPTLAEMNANNAAMMPPPDMPGPSTPTKQKKQKVKYVRG
ncbi:signal recognition particle, SRP19 subunit [Phycomyces nitens]|nr:signal recognition particle, SRP19 subunit [Phycomyces nitens]